MAVIKDKKCMIIGAAPLASGAVFEEFDPKEHYVICADAGYDTAVQYGVRPDLVIGDFDSAAEAEAYFAEAYLSRPDELAARGVFVETIKLGVGGQVSFSTTVPGVTRGNHYHTRKIERFTVIRGKARIQLRKIGTDKVYNFDLDGSLPSYVDMPIWYTHNITNTGKEELYTQFWISEWYDPGDGDTYFAPCDRNENYKVK